ncbi:ATL50 [Symbiodinium sp. KB8]|nr:ATL50 [Symbiodinium sp. KB8]
MSDLQHLVATLVSRSAAIAVQRALEQASPSELSLSALSEAWYDVSDTENEATCAVCLERIHGPGSKLPCSHSFHTACIMAWYEHRARRCQPHSVQCPLCRQLHAMTCSPPAQ